MLSSRYRILPPNLCKPLATLLLEPGTEAINNVTVVLPFTIASASNSRSCLESPLPGLDWAEAGEKPESATANTSTSENIQNIFRYMVLSPLQEYDLTMLRRANVPTIESFLEPPCKIRNKKPPNKNFGGLAVCSPVRIRRTDP